MNVSNKPVSEIIKSKDADEPKKQSREDWRKAKELEEARKAGTVPAAVDEEGKDINPHIPQYIATAPWYFGSKGPTLKHQRPQPERQKDFNSIDEYYKTRGDFDKRATKYRKGACENCGAITHSKKDCLERPRKVGAKYSGEDIAPDEKSLPELDLDYDGKRDRWNGFDPVCYQAVIEEYRKVEEAKRQLKEEKLKCDVLNGEGGTSKDQNSNDDQGSTNIVSRSSLTTKQKEEGDSEDDDGDEDKYADNADMPGTKVDSKQRITVRNLRIREDIAKYLRNLDPNSAYYDPKARAMRDNPYKHSGKTADELQYAGDNFVRSTGDTSKFAQSQLFAWQAYDKGVDVHLQAEPSKAELLHKEFLSKKEEFRHSMKDSILEKYGGAEHLEVPPKELLFAQTEDYVEYSRHGEIIKGPEKPIIRSKYDEDVFINNHTSVWGSYWRDGQWGYKCCHSFIKNSYCTGESGREIQAQSSRVIILPPEDEDVPVITDTQPPEDIVSERVTVESEESEVKNISTESEGKIIEEKAKKKKKKKKKKQKHKKNKKVSSDSESEDDEKKEEKAERMKKALERVDIDEDQELDERKRRYNSMYEVKAPTEEEMEAYYMKRRRPDDPMAAFLFQ